jgi:hypothetical protein
VRDAFAAADGISCGAISVIVLVETAFDAFAAAAAFFSFREELFDDEAELLQLFDLCSRTTTEAAAGGKAAGAGLMICM